MTFDDQEILLTGNTKSELIEQIITNFRIPRDRRHSLTFKTPTGQHIDFENDESLKERKIFLELTDKQKHLESAQSLVSSLTNQTDEKIIRKSIFDVQKNMQYPVFRLEFCRLNGLECLAEIIKKQSGNILACALNCLSQINIEQKIFDENLIQVIIEHVKKPSLNICRPATVIITMYLESLSNVTAVSKLLDRMLFSAVLETIVCRFDSQDSGTQLSSIRFINCVYRNCTVTENLQAVFALEKLKLLESITLLYYTREAILEKELLEFQSLYLSICALKDKLALNDSEAKDLIRLIGNELDYKLDFHQCSKLFSGVLFKLLNTGNLSNHPEEINLFRIIRSIIDLIFHLTSRKLFLSGYLLDFEGVSGVLFLSFSKVWKDMQASAVDYDQVLSVVKQQFSRVLSNEKILTFVEFEVEMNRLTLSEVNKDYIYSRSLAVPNDYKEDIGREKYTLIGNLKVQVLLKGDWMPIISKDKKNIIHRFCQLAPSKLTLHYSDFDQKTEENPMFEALTSRCNTV